MAAAAVKDRLECRDVVRQPRDPDRVTFNSLETTLRGLYARFHYNYRVVQLNFTLVIGVFCMLFDITFYFTITSVKKYIEYFNFRCKIQLDHPVQVFFSAW